MQFIIFFLLYTCVNYARTKIPFFFFALYYTDSMTVTESSDYVLQYDFSKHCEEGKVKGTVKCSPTVFSCVGT